VTRFTKAMAIGQDKLLYIGDFGAGAVQRFNISTGAMVDTFISGIKPTGLVEAADGSWYVLDETSREVRQYTSSGVLVGAVASLGTTLPYGAAMGPDGSLYIGVNNGGTYGIEKMTLPAGTRTAFATLTGYEPDFTWGPDGNLHLVDYGAREYRVYSPAAVLLRTMTSGISMGPCGIIILPCLDCDFGDLPLKYPTLLSKNGPRHTIYGSLRMGAAAVDGEAGGQPTADAKGDDSDADGDDEDGVTIPALTIGTTASITINSSGAGRVNAISWMRVRRSLKSVS
jgi:hypothetical protein